MIDKNFKLNITRIGDEYFLEFDTISNRNNMCLFTVQLMKIYEHEKNLNCGRFMQLRSCRQEYIVTLDIQGSRPEILKRYAAIVEWIADHCCGCWSIEPYMDSVGIGHADFGFSDATVAVPFALVWK